MTTTATKELPILFSGPMVRAILDGRKTVTRRIVNPQPKPYAGGVHPSHKPKHRNPYIDAYCSEPKTPENPRGMSTTWCWWTEDDRQGPDVARCPFGVPGGRLYVREDWRTGVELDKCNAADIEASCEDAGYPSPWAPIRYEADGAVANWDKTIFSMAGRKRLARFMPKWLSRLTLEVVSVRVERLQEIFELEAQKEGIAFDGKWWLGATHPAKGTPKVFENATGAFQSGWDALHGHGSWATNPWVWRIEFKRLEDTV